MAESGGVLRELVVLLGFEVNEQSLQKADGVISNLKESLKGLAQFAEVALVGLGIEKVAEWLHQTAESAEQTALAAEKLGMSTEQYQKLGYAAEQVGLSVEGVAHSFSFLQRAMAGAADGSKEQAGAFAQLGIHVKDAEGKTRDTNEVFQEVADKFKDIADPAKKAQLAMKIFGRAGVELIPLLNKGGEAIRQFGEDAESLGAINNEAFFESSENFLQTWKQIKVAFTAVSRAAAGPLLAALGHIMGGLVGWWKANQKIITSGVDKWFKAFGDVLEIVAQFLDPIFALLGMVATGLSQLNPFVVMLTAAGIALLLAWSPALVLFGLLGLILEDIYTYFKGGDSLTGDLVKSLKDLWNQLGLSLPKDGFLGYLANVVLPAIKNGLEDISVIIGALLSNPLELPSVIKRIATTSHDEMFGNGASADTAANPWKLKADNVGNGDRLLSDQALSVSPVNNITINAQTGATASDIAGHVTQALDDHHDKKMRETYNALVPAAH